MTKREGRLIRQYIERAIVEYGCVPEWMTHLTDDGRGCAVSLVAVGALGFDEARSRDPMGLIDVEIPGVTRRTLCGLEAGFEGWREARDGRPDPDAMALGRQIYRTYLGN